MIVLIPSYEPDERLTQPGASTSSASTASQVLVVDDGSGPGYGAVFGEALLRRR